MCSIRPLADRPVVDEERHLAARCRLRRVGRELHPHRHLALGDRLLGLLAEDEDAHHRVGVGQLPVVDEEREPAQVVGLGDDHTLGAARGITRSALIEYEWL